MIIINNLFPRGKYMYISSSFGNEILIHLEYRALGISSEEVFWVRRARVPAGKYILMLMAGIV